VFQRQSRVLNRNLNSLAHHHPSGRACVTHPRINPLLVASTSRHPHRRRERARERRSSEPIDGGINATPRLDIARVVIASSRRRVPLDDSSIRPTRVRSPDHPTRAAGVDVPTSPSTRRSHERIDRAKKIKSIVTTPRRDPRRRRPANANVKSHAPPSPPREPRSPPREPRSRSRARARARARVVPRT
jgi:hypothetical protein